MREAEQRVPDGRRNQTPLYLGATAGMRLLRSDVHAYARPRARQSAVHAALRLAVLCMCSMENSSAAEAVLRAVEGTLRGSRLSYQGSRTLSGQEEGAFGWVTVNYLDRRLGQVSRPRRG